MKMTQDLDGGQNLIRDYAQGHISVNAQTYRRSLIITAEHVQTDWPPQRFEELQPRHFSEIVEWGPEIVLIGTGARLRFPGPEIRRMFLDAQIGLEIMDTAAACRTYNIITMEGRRVAAALLMIESPRDPQASTSSSSV